MKVVDQKGKFFGLINILDLFLILLLIVALVFAGLKYTQNKDLGTGPAKQKEVTYVLYSSAEHPFVVDAIKPGDQIRSKDTNTKIGQVVSVEKGPGKQAVPTADGRMVLATVPQKEMVHITVKANATVSSQTAVVADLGLLAGNKVSIKGPKYMIDTVISSVNLGGK
ncbi:DUF4330 domain-containing protein [Aneurinibacillus sp. Ricciae_BoGa-3]|uniref:DUF4330 domain-containing protein n=1 Tax=Aneurinibacillus sp. Ricciae_BoGa-3 TaxID=3022697 RepID=UPI002340DB44|nr:DUF4330 domain-containing protein [Aneurinibacillus sp. Ricciae_BoGa-3]WCK53721.1 DUF4330 domain-containing protein [Aneurinibacillus sp. Ricciae_BoGa-3]